MDNIIFEGPPKQPPPRKRLFSHALSTERGAQDGPTVSQQQERILGQKHNDPDPNAIGPVIALEPFAASTNRHNNQRLRSNKDTGDDDIADNGLASLQDLFSLSEDNGHSTDNDSLASADDLFSPAEHNGQSTDSDTGHESASQKPRDQIPRDHSTTSDRRQGDFQSDPIILKDDDSDGGTAKSFKFHRRKPGSELGGYDSRIPLSLADLGENDSVMADTESQCSDEGVGRHLFTPTTRERRRHSGRARAEERDDDSLFDALSDDDDRNDAVGIRGANRQAVLSSLRRSVENIAHRISPQSKKRLRPASSESSLSDESDLGDNPKPSRKKAVLSSPPRSQETEYTPRLSLLEEIPHPDESQRELEEQVVWPYGSLLAFEVRDGKPRVLVSWRPTWEPPDEYSKKEVDRVKRKWESKMA